MNTSMKEHVDDNSVHKCKVDDLPNCETLDYECKADDVSNCETLEDEFKDIELEVKEEGFIGPRLPRLMSETEKEAFFKKIHAEFKLDLRD